jgi:hypothetical protein
MKNTHTILLSIFLAAHASTVYFNPSLNHLNLLNAQLGNSCHANIHKQRGEFTRATVK